ncbi:hypothetical protein WOLCODRAFT_140400 [Wolfiporia cocos MD-104 SS10]|uniref:F-box domain-containing protein n=1 Tax=Wolfiporia cocos (strain MD-104) TaxID=742152 RepID=A0A2H3J2K5_WOLCO|nr:hypothetical protein WOLCODRAFT_140400 [Wolfiporia cocos MD-104 SS10]
MSTDLNLVVSPSPQISNHRYPSLDGTECGLQNSTTIKRKPPELSQEVCDLIIEYLVSSPSAREDLKSCSLTCRRWVYRSRLLLYRRIRLKPTTNIDEFLAVYTEDKLLPYVSEVMILGYLSPCSFQHNESESGLDQDGRPDHSWMDKHILLLQRFTKVDLLHLHDLSWGDISANMRHFLLDHFRDVTRLTLTSVDFWNANQLFITLQSFARLKGLSMEHLSWHRANYTRNQLTQTNPLALQYLYLGETEFARYGPFVQWLFGNRSVMTVDHAVIVWEDTEIASLINLMRGLAPNLRTLVYCQHMVLPGSEVVEARLAAQNATDDEVDMAIMLAPTYSLPTDIPTEDAPHQVAHQFATAANHAEHRDTADAGVGTDNSDRGNAFDTNFQAEHVASVNAEYLQGEGDALGDDAEDTHNYGLADEDHDEMDGDRDDNDSSDEPPVPVEMGDDEYEDPEIIEKFVTENGVFLPEVEANARGIALLEEKPIEGSRIVKLHARVVWSTTALFGIKLITQMVTQHTEDFQLYLTMPSKCQWSSADWPAVDALLDQVSKCAAPGAKLGFCVHGGPLLGNKDATELHDLLMSSMPLVRGRKVWSLKYATGP